MIEMTPLEIDDLLAETHIGRLCMADPQGRPYCIPLPFCWDGHSIYLRLPLTGRKGEVLSANDRVCFEVDTFSESLDEYASVLVEGRLALEEDLAQKKRIKALNDEKYARLRRGFRPGHGRSTPLAALPIRRIVVEQVSGRRRQPQGALGRFAQPLATA